MQLERIFGIVLASVLALGLNGCQPSSENNASTARASGSNTVPTEEGLPQPPPPDTYTGGLGRQEGGAPAIDPPQATTLAEADRTFLTTAAQLGTLEVQAAKLAVEKSSGLNVRQFAKTMVENHSRVNDSLEQLAETNGVQIPMTPGARGEELLERLRRVQGPEFDRVYAEEMLRTHEQAVRLFVQATETATDDDVRAFARTQLPTLRDHLRLAHTLPDTPKG